MRYFYPKKIGDSIDGFIKYWENDKYGNSVLVLDVNGEEVMLPSHKSIYDQICYEAPGDHLYISLTDFEESEYYDVMKKIYYVHLTPKKEYWERIERTEKMKKKYSNKK